MYALLFCEFVNERKTHPISLLLQISMNVKKKRHASVLIAAVKILGVDMNVHAKVVSST